ncbi:MAG: TonB family protein [Ignavibacteriaceae bacterium]|nr:TonB family protein [Ignavibacteriaceae bacterium]
MDKSRNTELIILEVLGCLDEKDRKILQVMKETDENFPWNVLAEYQNLSALLPSILKIENHPSSRAKEIMLKKLHSLIVTDESIHQRSTDITKKIKSDEVHLEKDFTKNKIDWGSLSFSDSTINEAKDFQEIKPKTHFVKSNSIHTPEFIRLSEEASLETVVSDNNEVPPDSTSKSSPRLRRYILVSVILFVISASIFGYLLLKSKPEISEVLKENKLNDTSFTVLEKLQYNNLPDLENTTDVTNNQAIETSGELKSDKNVLPKAPPKLPDPIEAPLIETNEVLAEVKTSTDENISAPPPKEVVETNEEPTYFVAVEEMPQPIGGLQGIQQMIEYPEIAKRAGIEGKVFVRAFVDETGAVKSAEIVKGIGGGCDEAAMDAVLKTKFTPGKQRGKPIKVQVTIPIVFKR